MKWRVNSKSLLRKRLLVPFFALIVLIVFGVIFSKIANSPASGTVQESAPAESQPIASKPTYGSVSGKYVSFQYPSSFSVVPSQTSGNELEGFSLKTQQAPVSDLVVQASPLPSGQLSNNSSYTYRLQNPSLYKSEPISIGGQTYPVFKDLSGGYNTVAFAAADKKIVTVSLYCSDSSQTATLDSELKNILASLKLN